MAPNTLAYLSLSVLMLVFACLAAGEPCADSTTCDADSMAVELLQAKLELEVETVVATNTTDKAPYQLTAEQMSKVPKNLRPVNLVDLERGGVTVNQSSAIDPSYPDTYCGWKNGDGQVQRIDIAAEANLQSNQYFTVEGCYYMSCIAYGSSCGHYFYSNGAGGHCKCCKPNADKYYASSSGNDLYSCR